MYVIYLFVSFYSRDKKINYIHVCTLSPICSSHIGTDFPVSNRTLLEDGKQPPDCGDGTVLVEHIDCYDQLVNQLNFGFVSSSLYSIPHFILQNNPYWPILLCINVNEVHKPATSGCTLYISDERYIAVDKGNE